ncbi:MAG TPA: hypothetical protein PLL30_06585 [Candidatus Krumholzibacteria bacterium]|nr:hypothetical protein [Candidatus Krumholzibacteria bacterium]HPD71428.1 hypothetical protein [Candidatus Krumholzibacteria bacterium]HRY41639.1 hypothetical protein [Candidatus Krumholzibacteria bacterium]
MVRRRRQHRSRWQAVQRIEAVLDAVRGRASERYDRRDPERRPRAHLLDLQRYGRLFDRLAALDFEYLLSLDFAAPPEILRILLPQSVLGRAQNGHGFWRDEAGAPLVFRDATFDRVLAALASLDPTLQGPLVRQARGRRLERLAGWLHENLGRPELLLEDGGEPLLGVELLRDQRVATREFLRGMVLAGWMDDFGRRRLCMAHHRRTFAGWPLEIAGGQTFVVRPDLLAAVGIADPGRGEFAPEDLDKLADLGIIQREDREYTRPEYEQAYFRLRAGEGVSDDLALIWIGARHGWAAFLGAFVMDAVDTYDKFLWRFRPGGFDGRLAGELQARWREHYGEPLVADEEILAVIRFAAKLNAPDCLLSSSHRRFIQTEAGSKVATLLNHWRFLQGDPVYEIDLGYSRFPSRKFYEIAHKRLQFMDIDVTPARFVASPGRRR